MNQLIGFTLGDALKKAESEGFLIDKISITAPPKIQISEFDNTFRVLRVKADGNKLNILVCKPL